MNSKIDLTVSFFTVFVLFSANASLGTTTASLRTFPETTYSNYQTTSEITEKTTTPISTECGEDRYQEMCFGKMKTPYSIKTKNENWKQLGPIGPAFDPHLCGVTNISYHVVSDISSVKVHPPKSDSKFWTMELCDKIYGTSLICAVMILTTTEFTIDTLVKHVDLDIDVKEPISRSPVKTKTKECSDDQLYDLCFGKMNTTIFINQSRDDWTWIELQPLGPAFDPNSCGVTEMSYHVLENRESRFVHAKVFHPLYFDENFWTMGLSANSAVKSRVTILCTPISGYINPFVKAVYFEFVPICTEPVPQERERIIELNERKITENDSFLITKFHDESRKGIYTYKPFIVDKNISEFLSPQIGELMYDEDYNFKTGIPYTIKATKTMILKNDVNFLAALTSTRHVMNKDYCGEATKFINVTIKRGNIHLRKINIFKSNSTILRTAAPYARVIQPHHSRLHKITNFKCNATNVEKNPFNITNEGILYVGDMEALYHSPVDIIILNVTWIKQNKKYKIIQSEPLQVKLINVTVPWREILLMNATGSCASRGTKQSCETNEFRGEASGGFDAIHKTPYTNCVWREKDKNITNNPTLYDSCTPDPISCPDNNCDSLEMLHRNFICPQDCTQKVLPPLIVNPKTGRGVKECNGVLICDNEECSCNPIKKL